MPVIKDKSAKRVIPERVEYDPQTISVTAAAGEKLDISTGAKGGKLYEAVVPDGKKRDYIITVSIDETDA